MKYLLIFLFAFLVIPVYAVNDWRDNFPYLYIYDNPEYREIVKDDSRTYYVYDIPDFAQSYLTKEIVNESFNEWSELNPQLKFREVSERDNASIKIIFVKDIRHDYQVLGLSKEVQMFVNYSFNRITIDVMGDCNGTESFYSKDTIKDTIKHEIGHALGLEHNRDPNSLMYDPNSGLYSFADLGLDIPKPHEVSLIDC